MSDSPPISAGEPLPDFVSAHPVPAGTPSGWFYDFGEGPVAARQHPNGGGWVADTVDMDPEAFLEEGSLVFGRARVRGPVRVAGASVVCGYAWVWGNARIENGSQVREHAMVSEQARIDGGSVVTGRAWVTGSAYLGGCSVARDHALIAQDAWVDKESEVADYAQVYGAAQLWLGARAIGDEKLYGEVRRVGAKGD